MNRARLVLIVAALIVTFIAASASADAMFRSALVWSSAKANTSCPNDVCENSDWNIGASTSVTCTSTGVCDENPEVACSAYAYALGRLNWTGALRVKAAGCGAAGTQMRAPAQATEDTLAVTMARVDPNTLAITLVGVIGPGVGPPAPSGEEYHSFTVKVWKFGTFGNPEDTFDAIPPDSVIWEGTATLADDGTLTTSGALSPGDFTVVAGGYSIDMSYNIAYAGDDSVLAVGAQEHMVTKIPTLTEWGLIVLTLLLVGTSVLIIARRRLGVSVA